MSIAHVVLLGDTPEVAEVTDVLKEMAGLARRHGADQVHAGRNVAPVAFAGGLGHACLAVFPDQAALTAYLDDPDHQAVVTRLSRLRVPTVVGDVPQLTTTTT